ncbi:hypothetical protein KO506_11065 [Polaribacter vadi]|uniref:hypothetical protein n=1 Tax=Polaribacter TaxID=52959 RepID=UPI001C08E841|nr:MULTISPECIES: hypothetical protein [Polaribacter]MBU3011945.1 hypothetical protein [Polaribacter vadi]MDO6741760.1 hypothetical protein [Polaribacter sp. 1_MG-2023]
MKNKLQIVLVLFVIYLCSYFFYGKNTLGLQIIKDTNFIKAKDSIQIHIFDLNDYLKNQTEIISILKDKGFNDVKVNYERNFWNNNNFIYWLKLEQLSPFVNFTYNGYFKKNEISEEYESLYIWCFFKWIKVYKSKNRANY